MGSWEGKRVLVIGAARQGLALGRYLAQLGARVVLNDQRPLEQMESARQSLADLHQVEWRCGGHPLELLDGADLVCPSGGVPLTLPLVQEALRRGIPLSNDSQIFLEACPCRTIGITGSAGKTTTTTLVGRIAEEATLMFPWRKDFPAPSSPRKVWVGGNIGAPLLSALPEMQPEDLAILELSSFQLEIMTTSVNVAAVLNITPNHLDRHGTMEAYIAAKAHILQYQCGQGQTCTDLAVLGRDDPGAWSMAGMARGQVVSFGMEKPAEHIGAYLDDSVADEHWVCWWDGWTCTQVVPTMDIHLRGMHNLLNVMAASAISLAAALPVEAVRQAVQSFSGVPHRLELVRIWGGVSWYNDSIATAPERAMAAVRSFEEPVVLLAGGRDKDLPWEEFSDLVHQRVDHLVLFGEAVDKIYRAVGEVRSGRKPYTLARCQGLREAVQAAAQVAAPGDVVLLSPGGTSFDEFRDFEERGEAFRRWVHDLS